MVNQLLYWHENASMAPPPGDCESAENAIETAEYVCFEDSTEGTRAEHQRKGARLLRLLTGKVLNVSSTKRGENRKYKKINILLQIHCQGI